MKPKNESSLSPARISTWAMFLLSLALLDRLACEVGCLWGQELTSPSSRGAAIWEEQCIACHGGQGEGIEGKYEHRLSGPNTVEELASLIEQTMPEDDPGKCVGEDARAVAEFLLQRILVSGDDQQTARRVLQHLTANQYQLAVADLGEALLGGSEPAGELGLKAKYFDGREYKQDKRVAEQIDPRIDFDWQSHGPLGEKTGSEEFCIQWSGSVFIPETGEYEWLVRSPNGYRLFVNRQDEPLLDSWVATRDEPEKSAKLRLVGGRWYPVRVEALKVKDPNFSIQWLWRRPRRLPEVVSSHSLKSEMVKPTLLVQTPFPADDYSLGFERGSLFTPEWEEATTQAAWEVGDRILARLPGFVGAQPDAAEFAGKCRAFCLRFAEAAFRRPLEPAECERYVDALFSGRSPEEGVRISLLAILKSPWFLYRGVERTVSEEQQTAERMALALTDSWNFERAGSSRKSGATGRQEQQVRLAEGLLESPAGRAKWQRFFADWLGLEEAADISKDKEAFAEFDEVLLDDLQESVWRFVEDVWASPEADFRRLLLANELWMNERMKAVYAPSLVGPGEGEASRSDVPTPDEFQKFILDGDDRAGLLTHPLMLSQLAYFRSTSPIHRGVFITRKILGLALKPPPVAVEPLAEDSTGELTTRERVELQTRPDNCMGCHQTINPFGFALEKYDAIGRRRDLDRGRPIDAQVIVALPGREQVQLNGARELAEYLVSQRETHRHFVRAVFQHAVQQPPEGYSMELLDQLTDEFIASEFNMRKLIVSIALRTAIESGAEPKETSEGGE
ncbi:MAG: DUF1588 domain-containing protein [Planctomycetota bacterium]